MKSFAADAREQEFLVYTLQFHTTLPILPMIDHL
jgi:hypothetical protein